MKIIYMYNLRYDSYAAIISFPVFVSISHIYLMIMVNFCKYENNLASTGITCR